MEGAIASVHSGSFSIRKAAIQFDIPNSTLERHVNQKVQNPGIQSWGGRSPVLNEDLENELEEYALKMQAMFHGLTPVDLRKLAFDLAEINKVPHTFNTEKEIAGQDWLQQFLKRHPKLSVREPEPTSLCRATGFNKIQIGHFFKLYENILTSEKLTADRIFNVDETGLSVVQRPGKIVAKKGQKQVGKITSAERGKNHTAVFCMSASGLFVPPMLVFPRIRLPEALLRGAPPGILGAATSSGWMDNDTFVDWLKHFQAHVRPSSTNKVLLLLDNHNSHKSLAAIDYARQNGIIMLSIPPHTSQRIQPLDVTVFGPLKTYLTQAMDRWMKNHPGSRITEYDISDIFSEAYTKTASLGLYTMFLYHFSLIITHVSVTEVLLHSLQTSFPLG